MGVTSEAAWDFSWTFRSVMFEFGKPCFTLQPPSLPRYSWGLLSVGIISRSAAWPPGMFLKRKTCRNRAMPVVSFAFQTVSFCAHGGKQIKENPAVGKRSNLRFSVCLVLRGCSFKQMSQTKLIWTKCHFSNTHTHTPVFWDCNVLHYRRFETWGNLRDVG